MNIQEYSYRSSSDLCNIKAWKWYPDGDVKAVIQIHHGMAEHSGRYKNVVNALVNMGYAVYMNDMINHGESNDNLDDLGFFGEKDGYKEIIYDAKTLSDIAKKEYPNKKFIICGHSMGSFVMRNYINYYPNNFDGAIFIGTSGKNPLAKISIFLTSMVSAFKGKKYKSKWLYGLGFNGYEKAFEGRTSYDWGTRDVKSVDEYMADPKCGYIFSSVGFADLAHLVMYCNDNNWFNNVKKDVPVLLISGSKDPVGNFGKGIKEVYDRLIETGHTKSYMKLYDEARHEILNETNKEEVYEDIDKFISDVVLK